MVEIPATINTPKLFLSYCQEDEYFANLIVDQLQALTNGSLIISRYTEVAYGNDFRLFMDSIPDHDFVLSIVSDGYLKSQACMYEVGKALATMDTQNSLLYVVLSKNDIEYNAQQCKLSSVAKIYGDENERLDYIRYWKNEYEKLKKNIDNISDERATNHSLLSLREIKHIYKNVIGVFIDHLAHNCGKSYYELCSDNFSNLLQCIFPDWKSRLFSNCNSFIDLFLTAIKEIREATCTDYNQIALASRVSEYGTGLIVFADDIPDNKQRYRYVILEGLMSKAYSTGCVINVSDTNQECKYFPAVIQTKSEVVIPIKYLGNVIGVINSEAEAKNHFSPAIIQKLQIISNALPIALSQIGYTTDMTLNEIPYVHVKINSNCPDGQGSE